MRRPIACAAVMLGLAVQAAFALDPGEAGRQARADLKALMDKQRNERNAVVEKTADNAVPAKPSRADDRRAVKSIDSRVPTICRGC